VKFIADQQALVAAAEAAGGSGRRGAKGPYIPGSRKKEDKDKK